jgi:NADH:ubiquinone oxidoreductase subunit 4 (subunit M)
MKETKCYGFQLEVDFGIDTLSIVFLLLAGFLMAIVVLIVVSTLYSNQFYMVLLSLIYLSLT